MIINYFKGMVFFMLPIFVVLVFFSCSQGIETISSGPSTGEENQITDSEIADQTVGASGIAFGRYNHNYRWRHYGSFRRSFDRHYGQYEGYGNRDYGYGSYGHYNTYNSYGVRFKRHYGRYEKYGRYVKYGGDTKKRKDANEEYTFTLDMKTSEATDWRPTSKIEVIFNGQDMAFYDDVDFEKGIIKTLTTTSQTGNLLVTYTSLETTKKLIIENDKNFNVENCNGYTLRFYIVKGTFQDDFHVTSSGLTCDS